MAFIQLHFTWDTIDKYPSNTQMWNAKRPTIRVFVMIHGWPLVDNGTPNDFRSTTCSTVETHTPVQIAIPRSNL